MTPRDHEYLSLVIRIWWEGGSQGIIRGTVDIVQTGERLAFQTLPDLIEHLTRITGEEAGLVKGGGEDTGEA